MNSHHSGYRALLLGAAFVVVVAGMKAAASILLPVLVAVFFTVLTIPPINWLVRHRFPMWAATLAVFSLVLAGFGLVFFYLGASVRSLSDNLPVYQHGLLERTASLVHWVEGYGVEISMSAVLEYFDTSQIMGIFGDALSAFGRTLSNTLFVVLTMVFILAEATGLPRKIRAALGDPNADLDKYAKILEELQGYLGIKTMVSLVTGGLVGLACLVVDVDYPLLWAMLGFMLNFVPTLGSVIAAIPPVSLAYIQLGGRHAIVLAACYAVVNVVIGNTIEPRLMGRRFGLSTLVVFLSLVFWGWVWGPVGMVLCVPLTMVLKITLENTEDLRWAAVLLGSGAETKERSTMLPTMADVPSAKSSSSEEKSGS